MRGNPINVTRKFYDVTVISCFVTSTLHLHKAQNVRACHYMIKFSSAKTGQLVLEIFMFESVSISTCNMESIQKRKMHVELARLHLQQFLSHNSIAECFTEKKKQTTFPSSYGVLLQQREQEPLVCYSNTFRLRCPTV